MNLPPPFKIKMVESISLVSREEREAELEKARYNVFQIPSRCVYIDLLTDSGTGAMSDRQWSAMFLGDESYAGARSFENLQKTVRDILGHDCVIPTPPGPGGGERLFFQRGKRSGCGHSQQYALRYDQGQHRTTRG